LRIKDHPILVFPKKKDIVFFFEGKPVVGQEGDMIAFALHSNGIRTISYSSRLKRPRGFYCAIGNCGSCKMRVDGIDNVRTCITPIKENMRVEIQHDKGVIK
jgi:predicted molibdopterin-dependent oxidoreductase YjgC